MSRPRRSTRSSSPRTSGHRQGKQAKYLLQGLENRILFNTVVTDTDPLTITPPTATLEYKDARDHTVRITVHGDVSAEFVFARVTKGAEKTGFGGNDVILGDAVSPTSFDKDGKLVANPEDGRDLFHVYIAQASIDSYIAIAQVPAFSAKERPMQPFTGNVSLVVTPNRGTEVTKAMNGGTGNIYLGARTRDTAADIENEADRPVRTAVFNGQGLLPVTSNHRLVAGLTTAAGVSIGKFMFAGAVSGEVRFGGSVETFYCGALLTGTTEGQFEGIALDPGNFFVQGDIRNILVKGSIGTHSVAHTFADRDQPTYVTGTDFDIHGRVGQIRTGGDYLGTGIIHNDNPGLGLRTRQQEIEFRIDPGANRGSFSDFENGQFGDNEAFFNNDNFASAQFLGSINSKTLGPNAIQLNGFFQRDTRVMDTGDFYAVALMAGQQMTVRLLAPIVFTTGINGQTTEENSILHVGVFDPDKRLIATDYSNVTETTKIGPDAAANGTNTNGGAVVVGQFVDPDTQHQQIFGFTATKPGIYYIAVGETAPTFTANPVLGVFQTYQLQVTGVGNLGLGGLVSAGTIFAMPATNFGAPVIGGGGTFTFAKIRSITGFNANIDVERGDLGAFTSTGDDIVSIYTDAMNAIADGGDLRAFEALSLGHANGLDTATNSLTYGSPARLGAVTGSVGMIRSTGTDNGTQITDFNSLGRGGSTFAPTTIGGDVQYVVSPTFLITDLECNGSIGVVQASQFGTTAEAGSLSVNIDGKGKPGTIDLIDVTGDLGTLASGGPVISTNAGGNVRYIHISDTSTAFRPLLFGGSQPEETTFVQGQEANFTDDSGSQVTLIPTQEQLTDVNGNPLTDVNGNPLSNSGTLTVLTYPIARNFNQNNGGGGVVIIRAESTRGLQVRTAGTSAEIGTLAFGTLDPGPSLILNSTIDPTDVGDDGIAGTGDDPFELDPNSTNTQSIDIKGVLTDVFMVEGTNSVSVRNRTGGEIVNTSIGTTGLLEAENLGLARSTVRPGMQTEGSANAPAAPAGVFPFSGASVTGVTGGAKNAIVINGGAELNPAVLDVRSRQSIGNVILTGRAQNISANADNKGVKGVFEGIIGDVYATGQIRNVNIGEGLMPSGLGSFARAGLYANSAAGGGATDGLGRIENIVNQGLNSDVRGNIITSGGVGGIHLHDGSIINANIMTMLSSGRTGTHTGTGTDFTASTEYGDFHVVSNFANVDNITAIGAGGIIGTIIEASNVGDITSTGGFGIVNCFMSTLGAGRFGNVVADGLGIRGNIWFGGQSLQSVTVNGDGHRMTTSSFEPSVLFSGSLKIDPFFMSRPTGLTDLYIVTGTTPQMPQRKGVSASGSLDLSAILVSRDVGSVRANTIRASQFNIGNNVGSIVTNDYTDSLQVTAGKIDTVAIGKDALRTNIAIAGPVGSLTIGGSFRGSSQFAASGPNGSIGNVIVNNNEYGNISAEKDISSMRIGKSYGSQGTHTGGSLLNFVTGGDVLTGSVLDVNKTLAKLVIGGDFQDGATIKAGVLGTKTIIGADLGDIVIG